MQKDLISVIVTVYNEENLLYKCLFSIINQTYSNLEILIVDDGSSSETATICDHIKRWDKRIRVYHKPNGGLSDARNFGIKKAKGKYICFVDADDWVDKNIYEKLHEAILTYNVNMSMCKMRKILQTGVMDKERDERTYLANKDEFLDLILFKGNEYGCYAWNKMYEKSLFKGIEFPYGRYYEDKYVMHEIALKNNSIAVLTSSLYNYYCLHQSITDGLTVKHFSDDIDSYNKLFTDDRLNNIKIDLFKNCLTSFIWYIIKIYYYEFSNRKELMKLLKNKMNEFYTNNIEYCGNKFVVKFKINHPLIFYFPNIVCFKLYRMLKPKKN